jgi:hypothetical protein
LLLVTMLGLFGSNQFTAIGSIAVVIGGIVSLGSNVSTLRETMAAMSAAEVLRSDLISRIDLRVVGDRTIFGEESTFAELPDVIQVVPTGKWERPVYGEMEITSAIVSEFVQDFKDHVRKDLPFTAGHDNGGNGGETCLCRWQGGRGG